MRRNSTLAIIALLTSGCASTQPDRVYVDLNRVAAHEVPLEGDAPPMPNPKSAATAVVVTQAGLLPSSTADRTLERLEAAKKLIVSNRIRSIDTLSSMLRSINLSQAETGIDKDTKETQIRFDAILQTAREDLGKAFTKSAQEKGSLIVALNLLAGQTDLIDQIVPERADELTKRNIKKANSIRAEIRKLDAAFDLDAQRILAKAQKEISAERDALQVRSKTSRSKAEAQAFSEAESKANRAQISLDVQVEQLVPRTLPGVPSRQVTIPGSKPMSPAPLNTSQRIFGSLEERRHLLDREIEIWIQTTGRKRSLKPTGVRDVTEEFLQWRSAHKVGP